VVNNLYAAAEDTRDSTRLNDFCALSKQKGFKTFFLPNALRLVRCISICYGNGQSYWCVNQGRQRTYIFSHCSSEVLVSKVFHRNLRQSYHLDTEFPWHYTNDFFLWEDIKESSSHFTNDLCFSRTFQEVWAVSATVTPAMITNVWTKLEYKYDMCWTTYGAHVKHVLTV